MMKRELVEVKAKYETCHIDNENLRAQGEDLMILISEANMIKRDQHSIIQEYKAKSKNRDKEMLAAHEQGKQVLFTEIFDNTEDFCKKCYTILREIQDERKDSIKSLNTSQVETFQRQHSLQDESNIATLGYLDTDMSEK